MKSSFIILNKRTWVLETKDEVRKNLLQKKISYEEIVSKILKNAEIESIKREGNKTSRNYYRPVIIIKVSSADIDVFHNSCSGYRAQYYSDIKMGRSSNQYVIQMLIYKIIGFIFKNPKCTCPLPWFMKAILDEDSKIWIHQGKWLRNSKRIDQILMPRRWKKRRLIDIEGRSKKLLKWGTLTPSDESKLVIKGTFYNMKLQKYIGKIKNRDQEIHNWGYT